MAELMQYEDALSLDYDPLSLLTMTYTTEGFEELKQAIKKRGQQIPILLRNGKILDGRHRHKACMELQIGLCYEDVGAITDDEALDLVIDSAVNKAIGTEASRVEAYLLCKAKNLRQVEMVKKFRRLNIDYVKKMTYIEKENPDYLQAVLRQKQVRLYNKTFDKIEDYGTIHGIYKTLKGNAKYKDDVIEVTPVTHNTSEYDIDLADQMVTTDALKEYWELYYLFNITHPASLAGLKLKDIVNRLHTNDGELNVIS